MILIYRRNLIYSTFFLCVIVPCYVGFQARKSLRGLRGLSRLKTLVQGQSVQRQAATTLQCMQTLSRLQSQVRARKVRMSEENQSLQRQLQQKREKEFDKSQANVSTLWVFACYVEMHVIGRMSYANTILMRICLGECGMYSNALLFCC